MTIVKIENKQELICDPSYGAASNDLDSPTNLNF